MPYIQQNLDQSIAIYILITGDFYNRGRREEEERATLLEQQQQKLAAWEATRALIDAAAMAEDRTV